MNLYLFSIISKFLKFAFVSLVTLFNTSIESFDVQNVNKNLNKDSSASATIIDYDTKFIYNSSIPIGESNILEDGSNGAIYDNSTVKQDEKDEVIEVGTGVSGEYIGKLTGYGPDCVGCSEQGYVTCSARNGKPYSLKTDGIYYTDEDYGRVRILASSTYFSCGTIIEVKRDNYSFMAIVLDRGSDMNNAWKNGNVWFDLAYESQATVMTDLNKLGDNFEFKVKRWGW